MNHRRSSPSPMIRAGNRRSLVSAVVARTQLLVAVALLVGTTTTTTLWSGTTTTTSAPVFCGGFVDALVPYSRPFRTSSTLGATGGGGDNSKPKPKKAQGVYVRPSGAIEKGSGFFVPGLEGPKVRLVIGMVLLAATAVNHFVYGNLGSFGRRALTDGELLSFSEVTAILYSVLLLFQSAIEYAKESLPEPSNETSSKASAQRSSAGEGTEVLDQKWSSSSSSESDEDYRSRVQWAAASYVSMTPTTQIMLLARTTADGPGGVRYRLGSETNRGSDSESNGVSASLEELARSKGGRIALPLTHPACEALLATGDDDTEGANKLRTVILQRITDDSCWMVASDQLLAGYTSGDLKWLGKLAGYVAAQE